MIQSTKDGELVIIKTGTPIDGNVLMWTTFYYCKGIVIDGGCPNTAEEAYKFVKDLGDIDAVVLTHHHEDHIGLAQILSNEGFDVYISKHSIDILRNPPDIPEYRRIVWGQPKPINALPLEEELNIKGIDIKVYKAPGHSKDHVVFQIDDYIFIGDLIGSLKPKIAFYSDNYSQILESVENVVLTLDFEKAYGGHIITTKDEIPLFIEYIKYLKNRIRELREDGHDTNEIIDLLWDRISEKVLMMEAVSGGEWHRRYLVETLL
jgi:glyoxylase-like metal-dependent hydrolase (beta-lactamase superfamily II)